MAICCAVAAFANVMANVARSGNPHLALLFWPRDAGALALAADRELMSLATSTPGSAGLGQIAGWARQSVEVQAINPRALRVFGMVQEAFGRVNSARDLIRLSARMSRRDAGTQLWLIEDGVRRNDIPAILQAYDVALRANSDLQGLFFPRLLSALQDQVIQQAFAPYVSAATPWLAQFVSFAVQAGDPSPVAQAIERAGGMPKTPLLDDLEPEIVRRLIETGRYEYARHYFVANIEGGRGIVNSTSFDTLLAGRALGPFAWSAADAPGAAIGFQKAKGAIVGIVDLDSPPTEVVVLRKIIMLSPGKYYLRGKVVPSTAIVGPHPFWRVTCLSESSDQRPASLSPQAGSLLIPPKCVAQSLELMVPRGDYVSARYIVHVPSLGRAL